MCPPEKIATGTPRIRARILPIIGLMETQTFAVDQVLANERLLLLAVQVTIDRIDW